MSGYHSALWDYGFDMNSAAKAGNAKAFAQGALPTPPPADTVDLTDTAVANRKQAQQLQLMSGRGRASMFGSGDYGVPLTSAKTNILGGG